MQLWKTLLYTCERAGIDTQYYYKNSYDPADLSHPPEKVLEVLKARTAD